MIGSVTYGSEVFKGKRADTFARAVGLLSKRRADLTQIKSHKYPLAHYREALIDGSNVLIILPVFQTSRLPNYPALLQTV